MVTAIHNSVGNKKVECTLKQTVLSPMLWLLFLVSIHYRECSQNMNVQSVAWIIKLRHYPALIQSPGVYI